MRRRCFRARDLFTFPCTCSCFSGFFGVFVFFEKYVTSFPFPHLLTAKLRRSQISFVLDYHLYNLSKTHVCLFQRAFNRFSLWAEVTERFCQKQSRTFSPANPFATTSDPWNPWKVIVLGLFVLVCSKLHISTCNYHSWRVYTGLPAEKVLNLRTRLIDCVWHRDTLYSVCKLTGK